MQNAKKEIILDNYVWISRVGSDQVWSGNRLSVIGVGYYLKMYTKGRQLSCETSIHRFCGKNGRWGVLGHVDSESGIRFVIRQLSTVYGQVFSLNSVQSADSPTLKNADLKKFNNFLFMFHDSSLTNSTLFFLKLPDLDLTCIFASRHNTNTWSTHKSRQPQDKSVATPKCMLLESICTFCL